MTVEIKRANVVAAYQAADAPGKDLLSRLFGRDVLDIEITDQIEDFDDVLTINSIDAADFWAGCEGLSEDEIAYRQIKEIVKAYNQGWTPDWNDSDQPKYYAWFKIAGSASGFSFRGFGRDNSDSDVGSRLVFKERESCTDAAKKFTDIYKKFFIL